MQPGRRLVDWPADVRALADQLDVETFGVIALSAGAPYALACAHALPDRISGVAIAGGLTPLQSRWQRRGMKASHRAGLAGVRTFPRGAKVAYRVALPAFQAHELRRHPGFRPTHKEAHRQGTGGCAQDLGVLARPWGFEPAEIRRPVEFWHGDRDGVIPLELAAALAAQIAGSELHVCLGEGHLLLPRHLRAVLRVARPRRR